ncbi:hypothetical protein PoB_000825000 [Plakobranchus ocellatus]|uniref:Uncharacterized protein n=1 Tax=Plakobranchus ocellatus TaxID=259542 RepID=A0AAV3YGV4_9GAST|nr:hypothetical protein PoB_000825000 [Plakobranchus ocellatus]
MMVGSSKMIVTMKRNKVKTDIIMGDDYDADDDSKPVGPRPVRNGVLNIPVPGENPGNQSRSPQNDECQLIEILKKSAEDALSASSGDTDPSDSGRGGSEDECSHRIDPENSNGRPPHSKGHRSPSNAKVKDQQRQRQQQHQKLHDNARGGSQHPPSTSRQLSSSSNSTANTSGMPSMKSRPISRVLEPSYPRENPRDSLTSDFGSDFSGSRPPSQSRTDSDRSVPPPPAPRPTRDPSLSQMLPFTRPAPISTNHTHSSSPSSRDLHNNHHNPGYPLPSSRALFSRDSPNRLAGPHPNSSGSNNPHINHNNIINSNYNNSLLRSFHGQRGISNRQQQNHVPNLSSVSLERLPRSSPTSSSPASQLPPYYSDRAAGGGGFYPSIPERWDRRASSVMAEEDDRTTTSGSYTINPDDLRQDIDELILQDSVV